MKKLLLLIVSITVLVLAGTANVIAKQGDENLPCVNGGEWILSPFTGDAPSFDGLTFLKQTGSAVHYISGPLDQDAFNAIASQDDNLKLSHCLEGSGGSGSPTPTPTPSPTPVVTPTPTPSESPTPTPTPTPTETPTPTPSESPSVPEIPNTAFK